MRKEFLYFRLYLAEEITGWFIVSDDNGSPIYNIDEAQKYLRKKYGQKYYFGLSDKKQMKLNNDQRDNF